MEKVEAEKAFLSLSPAQGSISFKGRPSPTGPFDSCFVGKITGGCGMVHETVSSSWFSCYTLIVSSCLCFMLTVTQEISCCPWLAPALWHLLPRALRKAIRGISATKKVVKKVLPWMVPSGVPFAAIGSPEAMGDPVSCHDPSLH